MTTPNDQTSLADEKMPELMASGAVHLHTHVNLSEQHAMENNSQSLSLLRIDTYRMGMQSLRAM